MSGTGRERLLAAALHLFAAKGYAATSVADVQRASGLAAGSGALYKHFSSKQELLGAAVRHRIEGIIASREQFDAARSDTVDEAVRRAGRLILGNFADSVEVVRVMLREPDALGDLEDLTWQVISDNAYQRFADEFAALNRSGRAQIPDPQAAAAVAISALSYFPTLHALTGRTPGNLPQERFFEAWVVQVTALIQQFSTTPAPTSGDPI